MKKPAAPPDVIPLQRPSHHRRPRKVPVALSAFEPPADLLLSDAERSEWIRLAPLLPLLNVDMTLDRAVILCYVQAVAQLQQVRALWTGQGSPATVARPSGERVHPLLELIRQLQRDAAAFGEALGLSPKGRRLSGVVAVAAPAPRGSGSDPASRYFDD